MRYKVIKAENKTAKTGRPYKKLNIGTDSGEVYDVNIFSSFPDFANVNVGSEIMGNLTQNGQFWNIEPEGGSATRGGASGGYKEKVIGEAMQRKEGSIAKFQDNKEWSIMVASSMNKAIDLAIAEGKDDPLYDLALGISKWRTFILDNWEVDPKSLKPF